MTSTVRAIGESAIHVDGDAQAGGLLVLAPVAGAQAQTSCPYGESVVYVFSHDSGIQYDLQGHGADHDVTVAANGGDCFIDASIWGPYVLQDADSGLCLGWNQTQLAVQEQNCNNQVAWQWWYPTLGVGYGGGTVYQNGYGNGDNIYMQAEGLVGGERVNLSSDNDYVLTSWFAAPAS